jgi:hypothetical protein
VVGFFCLIAITALFIQPIAVGGFILWGGFAVVSAYGVLKLRSDPATKVSFFEDRIELSGSRNAVYTYPQVDTVFVSDLSKVGKVTFKDGSPSISIGPKPKGGSATDFYEWL